MNMKTFISNLRRPKRPKTDIMQISNEALLSDFTKEQMNEIREFPVELMTIDEQIVLTQALSTFNTLDATNENPVYYSGDFRFKTLESLFKSDNGQLLIETANRTESNYSSSTSILPYLTGKYSSNKDLLVDATANSETNSNYHRVGFVFNDNLSPDILPELYQTLKESHSQLKSIEIACSTLATRKDAPIELLIDIENDFDKSDEFKQFLHGPAVKATANIRDRYKPVSISVDTAKQELSDFGFDVNIDNNAVTLVDSDKNIFNYSVNDEGVLIPDNAPDIANRAVTSILNAQYNDELTNKINNYRESKLELTISFDGLENADEYSM